MASPRVPAILPSPTLWKLPKALNTAAQTIMTTTSRTKRANKSLSRTTPTPPTPPSATRTVCLAFLQLLLLPHTSRLSPRLSRVPKLRRAPVSMLTAPSPTLHLLVSLVASLRPRRSWMMVLASAGRCNTRTRTLLYVRPSPRGSRSLAAVETPLRRVVLLLQATRRTAATGKAASLANSDIWKRCSVTL